MRSSDRKLNVILASSKSNRKIPSWLEDSSRITLSRINLWKTGVSSLHSDLVILDCEPADYENEQILDRLRQSFSDSRVPAIFIFSCRSENVPTNGLQDLFSHCPNAGSRVEFAIGDDDLRSSFQRALLRRSTFPAERGQELMESSLRSGAEKTSENWLEQSDAVTNALVNLRSPRGRLSADRVARVFGLSLSKLATLLGKDRQTVHKTPDSLALQPLLRPFERIAMLRALLADDAEFHAWLNRANAELEDAAPLEFILAGGAELVADLVHDMLTGTPG